jgi:hypothetical protein
MDIGGSMVLHDRVGTRLLFSVGLHQHQSATTANTFRIVVRFIFGHALTHERTNQTTCRGPDASTQGCGTQGCGGRSNRGGERANS